jgi:uncharacterized membrane protein YhiD involved in acid resistance
MGLVIGFGRYLLTVAGVLLTVGALSGLRMFQTLLRHWAGSRERYVLSTNASFSVGLVVEVAQHERVAMRALERRATGTGGQIVLLAGLPPRYHPERLVELLARLEGVHEVEWKHEAGR